MLDATNCGFGGEFYVEGIARNSEIGQSMFLMELRTCLKSPSSMTAICRSNRVVSITRNWETIAEAGRPPI